jgi:hypothetical protein
MMGVEGNRHQENQCASGQTRRHAMSNLEENGTIIAFPNTTAPQELSAVHRLYLVPPGRLRKTKHHSVVESGLFLGYRSGPFLGNLDCTLCGAVNRKNSETERLRISQRRPVAWTIVSGSSLC